MKTSSRTYCRGFTLVEIMIVVAIIALLAAITIPNLVQARDKSRRRECLANQEAIALAKAAVCADTNAAPTNSLVGEAEIAFLDKVGKKCPAGGTYSAEPCGESPKCSYHGAL